MTTTQPNTTPESTKPHVPQLKPVKPAGEKKATAKKPAAKKPAKKAAAKKPAKAKAKTAKKASEPSVVVALCNELKIDPKVGRAKLRRHGVQAPNGRWGDLDKSSATYKKIVSILKDEKKASKK